MKKLLVKFCVLALATTLLTTMAAAVENPFTDVSSDSDLAQSVMWALENGITSGTTTTTFAPDDTCTRGQVVTFLWRAKGEPTPAITENPFTDVDSASPFYTAILWAVGEGITNGTSDTTFAPSTTCTSGQVVTFLYRAMGEPETTYESAYADGAASAYVSAINWADETALLEGMDFAVSAASPRSDIVTYLYRDAGSPTITIDLPSISGFSSDVSALGYELLSTDFDVYGSKYGAMPINLTAGSCAVNYNNTLYYVSYSSIISSFNLSDNTATQLIFNEYYSYENIQVYGDKIYFIERLNSGRTTLRFCSMNLDGSGYTIHIDEYKTYNGVSLQIEGYYIYDGRIYMIIQDAIYGNHAGIMSYSMTMGDAQQVYTSAESNITIRNTLSSGAGLGGALSLGFKNDRMYFVEAKNYYSVNLQGGDKQSETYESCAGAGMGIDMTIPGASSNADGTPPRAITLAESGLIYKSYVAGTNYTSIELLLDGDYICTVNTLFWNLNFVTPTTIFVSSGSPAYLLSLDGSSTGRSIPASGTVTALSENRITYTR